MDKQGAFVPLVVASVAAACILALLDGKSLVHWVPIHLALGVVGGLVCFTSR